MVAVVMVVLVLIVANTKVNIVAITAADAIFATNAVTVCSCLMMMGDLLINIVIV